MQPQAEQQAVEHRGRMIRSDRQMSDQDTLECLRRHCTAHIGTSDASFYEGADLLYLHTGPHPGHFLGNVRENPRICIQLNETGPWQRGAPTAFDSSLVYKSVILFGKVGIMQDPGLREKKIWFIDHLLERLNDSKTAYEKPYPSQSLDRIILYEVALEIVTGKRNVGLH